MLPACWLSEIAMSNNNKHPRRDLRLGGEAGTGMPISDVVRVATQNSTRSDHDIGGAAPRYGDQSPITLHQGEVPASNFDAGLDHNPQARKHNPRPAAD
jgi:hypothetical protein